MAKRTIVHDLGTCVHCGNCAETFPSHWTLRGEIIEEDFEEGLTPIKDLRHICPLGAYKEA
jgi:ferredoxin